MINTRIRNKRQDKQQTWLVRAMPRRRQEGQVDVVGRM